MAVDVSGWFMNNDRNPALYKIADTLQDNVRYKEQRDFRNQRIKEQDDWRKLQLIQELSNVDKYQTGDSVADALGNMKAAEILQKYTAEAGKMSPAELQYKISQDIQNTASGMQGFKDELAVATKTFADLKSKYPSVDTRSLDKYFRQDIINRRMENGEFKNPIHVNPTNMRFDDPDFLAAFVSGDKAIRDEIVNPKLVEKGVQVGMGSPSSYTAVGGDIPFFRERNFDPEKDIKEGFLKKGIEPHMILKSKVEKVDGKDIETLREDAYEVFSDNAKLEFNALAARQNPNFYNLSREDRNKLTRQIAFEQIKGIDQSDFSFKSATKPPSNRTTINMPGSEGNLNNIYEGIKKKGLQRAKDYAEGNYINNSLEASDLDGDELEVVLKATQRKDLLPEDIKIIVEANGRTGVYNKGTGERLVYLNQTGVNLPKQANVAAKKESVVKGDEEYKPFTNPQSIKVDLSQYDIPKGAVIKYAADGKTPLGYELNGKKYKFQ